MPALSHERLWVRAILTMESKCSSASARGINYLSHEGATSTLYSPPIIARILHSAQPMSPSLGVWSPCRTRAGAVGAPRGKITSSQSTILRAAQIYLVSRLCGGTLAPQPGNAGRLNARGWGDAEAFTSLWDRAPGIRELVDPHARYSTRTWGRDWNWTGSASGAVYEPHAAPCERPGGRLLPWPSAGHPASIGGVPFPVRFLFQRAVRRVMGS